MHGLLSVTAVAAMLLVAGAAIAAMEKPPQEIVDERVGGMKQMQVNLKGASEAPTPEAAKPHFAAAIKFAESIPVLFPKGTGIGDAGVNKTRALQEIWMKPAEFKAAAEALRAALKAAAAAGGDKPALDKAFGDIRKSCADCHKPFRGPETE